MTSLCVSGVQLALAEAQSQLPHTARAGVTGILADAELPQDPTAAHTGAAQRRTIEDLLVTIPPALIMSYVTCCSWAPTHRRSSP